MWVRAQLTENKNGNPQAHTALRRDGQEGWSIWRRRQSLFAGAFVGTGAELGLQIRRWAVHGPGVAGHHRARRGTRTGARVPPAIAGRNRSALGTPGESGSRSA